MVLLERLEQERDGIFFNIVVTDMELASDSKLASNLFFILSNFFCSGCKPANLYTCNSLSLCYHELHLQLTY